MEFCTSLLVVVVCAFNSWMCIQAVIELSSVLFFGSCGVYFEFMDVYCKDGTNSHACMHSFVSKPLQVAMEWSCGHHFW